MPEAVSNSPKGIIDFYRDPVAHIQHTRSAQLGYLVGDLRIVESVGLAGATLGFFLFFKELSEGGSTIKSSVDGLISVGLLAILGNIHGIRIAAQQILRKRGIEIGKPLDPA